MKKIIFILLILAVGCTTTHFKTKEQLQKEHTGIKYFSADEQFELNVSNIISEGWTYLYCYDDGRPRGRNIDSEPPRNITKVKIIGIYEWVEKNEVSILGRSMDVPSRCAGTYYVCEAENYGYVFFPKERMDKLITSTKQQEEKNKKEQEFLDKLKPADRDLILAVKSKVVIISTNVKYLNTVETAIKEGANVNVTDLDGNTPLIIAAGCTISDADMFDWFGSDHLKKQMMVEDLLENKARVNSVNKLKVTALMMASKYGNTKVVKLLIVAGADVNLRDIGGKSACDYAEENNYTKIMEILKTAGAK